jgi:hypothetical protein
MNIRPLVSSLSALAISVALLPLANFPAQAQMVMRFTTPFVTDSGFVGAAGDMHYITLAITGFSVESATVGLPIDMGRSILTNLLSPIPM